MSLPLTIRGVPVRVFALRGVLLLAALLGLLTSAKLWLTARDFPLVPVVAGWPQCPAPWDAAGFALLLGALVTAFWFYRPAVAFFLAGVLWLYCGDQNRGQPWMYLYFVLLLLTLRPEKPALAGCRLIVTAVYVWAAVQKFGPDYQRLVVPYMLQPLTSWLPASGLTVAKWCLSAGPVIELFIGVGLWVPSLRRAAIIATVLVHGVALLLLGPLGHNYNLVVWPWNLAMIALVVVLFPPVRFGDALRALRESAMVALMTALVTLLPVLSWFGWWDSYFSFALYSGNTATADLILAPAMAGRLPEPWRRFAHPLHADVIAANPELRGLFVFDLQSWAQADLGVPPVPEPRNYRALARALARFAEQPDDLQLILSPRRGPVQVLRAGDLR